MKAKKSHFNALHREEAITSNGTHVQIKLLRSRMEGVFSMKNTMFFRCLVVSLLVVSFFVVSLYTLEAQTRTDSSTRFVITEAESILEVLNTITGEKRVLGTLDPRIILFEASVPAVDNILRRYNPMYFYTTGDVHVMIFSTLQDAAEVYARLSINAEVSNIIPYIDFSGIIPVGEEVTFLDTFWEGSVHRAIYNGRFRGWTITHYPSADDSSVVAQRLRLVFERCGNCGMQFPVGLHAVEMANPHRHIDGTYRCCRHCGGLDGQHRRIGQGWTNIPILHGLLGFVFTQPCPADTSQRISGNRVNIGIGGGSLSDRIEASIIGTGYQSTTFWWQTGYYIRAGGGQRVYLSVYEAWDDYCGATHFFSHWDITEYRSWPQSNRRITLYDYDIYLVLAGNDVTVRAIFGRRLVANIVIRQSMGGHVTKNSNHVMLYNEVIFTAIPEPNWRLVGWYVNERFQNMNPHNGNSLAVRPTNFHFTVRARFERMYTVSMSVNDPSFGHIYFFTWTCINTPGGWQYGRATNNRYPSLQGEYVQIEAYPVEGFVFDRWEVLSGNISLIQRSSWWPNSVEFLMPGHDVSVRAHFRPSHVQPPQHTTPPLQPTPVPVPQPPMYVPTVTPTPLPPQQPSTVQYVYVPWIGGASGFSEPVNGGWQRVGDTVALRATPGHNSFFRGWYRFEIRGQTRYNTTLVSRSPYYTFTLLPEMVHVSYGTAWPFVNAVFEKPSLHLVGGFIGNSNEIEIRDVMGQLLEFRVNDVIQLSVGLDEFNSNNSNPNVASITNVLGNTVSLTMLAPGTTVITFSSHFTPASTQVTITVR